MGDYADDDSGREEGELDEATLRRLRKLFAYLDEDDSGTLDVPTPPPLNLKSSFANCPRPPSTCPNKNKGITISVHTTPLTSMVVMAV
jgi:hypothetical protein